MGHTERGRKKWTQIYVVKFATVTLNPEIAIELISMRASFL